MKADKAIRLMKTIDPLAIRFRNTGVPYIVTVDGYNNGWTLNTSSQAPSPGGLDVAYCTWEDTIDIAGLAANDISLVNQGGAIARPISPYYDSEEIATVQQMTIVSVNPIELTYLDVLRANALDVPGQLQDYFLATTQEFTKSADQAHMLSKTGEYNFGTGGIAQATKLYVKSIAILTVKQIEEGTPPVVRIYDDSIFMPPATVAIGGVTAELDQVQMAAAIYRANDQE